MQLKIEAPDYNDSNTDLEGSGSANATLMNHSPNTAVSKKFDKNIASHEASRFDDQQIENPDSQALEQQLYSTLRRHAKDSINNGNTVEWNLVKGKNLEI